MVSGAYAGDVSPREAWDLLATEANAVLVDVRTQPEWSFVGQPDLTKLGKRVVPLSWQVYPGMQVDAAFADRLAGIVADRGAPILFLCRSGARSKAAAIALTGRGYSRCYNIANGFEGGLDADGHRGQRAGWKADGLPWVQE
ncbi:MAG: rhodanese-like domain-containing protein [Dongiaceae bacterium]